MDRSEVNTVKSRAAQAGELDWQESHEIEHGQMQSSASHLQ